MCHVCKNDDCHYGEYCNIERDQVEAVEKFARNARVQARYDELMAAGKHGHYESLFKVVHEEIELERQGPHHGLAFDHHDAVRAMHAEMPDVPAPLRQK